MEKTKIVETRCVTVLRKSKRTESLADIWAVENGSNKKYSVKFQGINNVECLMNDINPGTMLIIRGFMGEYKGKPEFNVYSFEINDRVTKAFYPSEDIEYVVARPKNKAIN
jgi:hypothetical protein